MKKPNTPTSLLFVLVALSLFSCKDKTSEPEKTKPNIIFIMSDDHTTQGFGIYGSRLAQLDPTPNLDKIAKEGIIFDNCFVNNAICTPSRAAIISGQNSQANGVLDLEGAIGLENSICPRR